MQRNSDNRTRTGAKVSIVGIACNLLLSACKITAGILFGAVSVVADGFNNLSDCGSGIVSLVSFFIASKKPDKEHPYGHRRAEYIASMAIGFLVLFVAVSLLRESVVKTIDGGLFYADWIVYTLLGVSVAIKSGMFVLYRVFARRLSSDTLRASATDSLCDCIATFAVAVGAVLARFGIGADGFVGIAVSLFIGWQGFRILSDASSKLLGQAPNPKQTEQVKSVILSHGGVLGLHDLHIFCYGDGVNYATVHIEMDASLSALDAHATVDKIEQDVLKDFGIKLTAHLDPVDLNDLEAVELEKTILAEVSQIADGLEIHDFRMIRGAVVKLVFDVGVPYECKLSDAEIYEKTLLVVKRLGDYETAVTVERE